MIPCYIISGHIYLTLYLSFFFLLSCGYMERKKSNKSLRDGSGKRNSLKEEHLEELLDFKDWLPSNVSWRTCCEFEKKTYQKSWVGLCQYGCVFGSAFRRIYWKKIEFEGHWVLNTISQIKGNRLKIQHSHPPL